MFNINVPTSERLFRVLLGLALAAYAWIAADHPNLVFVSTGICVAMTGLIGFCPACALVGRRLKPKA